MSSIDHETYRTSKAWTFTVLGLQLFTRDCFPVVHLCATAGMCQSKEGG